ncbi:swr1 complex component, partial [Ceratobasidium sp. 423]
MSDGDLTERRTSLIEQKKRELDEVYDRHDSLLRELFHLQKFVTLIGFDPNVAKQERSEVWEEFRAPYDLWDQSSSGPSSRRTRRAINERREFMAASTSQTPALYKKQKSPDAKRLMKKGSMPNLTTMSPTSVLAPKRSLDTPKPYGAKVIKNKSFTRPVTPSIISRKRSFGEQDHEEDRDHPDFPRASSPTADNGVERGADGLSMSSSPKKRKQKYKQNRSSAIAETTPFVSTTPARPLSRPAPPQSSPDSSPGSTPLPKRIRLIVKPAPLPVLATHPDQLPRPAVFGGSLSRLLSSFALLEEGDEDEFVEKKNGADPGIRQPGYVTPGGKLERPRLGISWREFDESVKAEVEIWRRIREVRARGGLGCMRGWEIVRGEEDEPEEEEEEEGKDEDGDVRAKAEEESEGGEQAEQEVERVPTEGMVKETGLPGKDVPEQEILDDAEATSMVESGAGLEHAQADGPSNLSTIIISDTLPAAPADGSLALDDSPVPTPGDNSISLVQTISTALETPAAILDEYPNATGGRSPMRVGAPLADATMDTEPLEPKEPVTESMTPEPNETFMELEMSIPQSVTPATITQTITPA